MSDKRRFFLVNPVVRQRAIEHVQNAPDGYEVVVKEPTRSLEQNALLWTLLHEFEERAECCVNGFNVKLSAEDWKTVLTAAFRAETQRMATYGGRLIFLGQSTSKMGKKEFSEFLEFIQSEGVERGINWGETKNEMLV